MTKAQALAKRKREIEGEIENLQAILAGIEEAEKVLLAPKPAEAEEARQQQDLGLDFHNLLSVLGSSRELSIAKTKVEEAVMWAVKHITA